MDVHPAQLDLKTLQEQCETRRQRRSGPGGQHRNKVETGIFIEHTPTGVRAEATEGRSQHRNLELATHRLRVNLAIEFRMNQDSDKPLTALWTNRCRGGKLQVNELHADFPALLAEALDMLAQVQWDAKLAAEKLKCSSSQLIKFLKREPRGWAELNQQRERLGLHKLH